MNKQMTERKVCGDQVFSPAKHEHVAGAGVVFQGHELLQTQLLAASVETVRAVDAPGVVIAT